MPRVFAPSDLADERILATGVIRVAGRVAVTSARDVFVRDAFATLRASMDDAHDLTPGDLVVLEGTVEGRALAGARVAERHRPTTERALAASSETARFAEIGGHLRARALAIGAAREFFASRGYLEVDTPAIVPSPGLDLHLDAFEVTGAGYLITSPEYQMKRLLAGGVPRCFQLARCFRRREEGDRHNPEFTMLEWYRAFATIDDLCDDTEALVRHVLASVARARGEDLFPLAPAPFERLTVGEAFARWADVAADDAIELATTDEDRFFRLLVERVEPAIERHPTPIFLGEYPAPFASLARRKPSDPRVAERVELYLGGVEIANGFGELTDPVEQRARLERDRAARAEKGLPVYPIDERFLAALEEGMPPSAGNALGLDRLVALALGGAPIHRVQAFPARWL